MIGWSYIADANKIWAQSEKWLLRYNTKGDLTFDFHLHSQDGPISTWCFYVFWLANHIAYACKIWDRLDLAFRRYKTKEIWPLTFICIPKMASNQLGFILWYDWLITLHMPKKFRVDWPSGCWDTKQRECVCGRVCVCVCVCVCDLRRWEWVN